MESLTYKIRLSYLQSLAYYEHISSIIMYGIPVNYTEMKCKDRDSVVLKKLGKEFLSFFLTTEIHLFWHTHVGKLKIVNLS